METIGGDRPPINRLGSDTVIFDDIREFVVAYSEYEQQMLFTNFKPRWWRPGAREEG